MDWLQNDNAIQWLKTLGLVLFFVIFSGVLLWVALRKRSEISRWSRLPLDDDPKPAANDHGTGPVKRH